MESRQSNAKPITFKHWSSSFYITSDGKHIVEFPKDFPLTIGCNRFSFDRRLAPNYHDYFEISYIHDGTGMFRIGNDDYPVQKGDLVVLGNTEIHTLLTHGHNPVDVISIFFLPELIYRPGYPGLDFEYIRFFYHYSYKHSNYIPAGEIDSERVFNLMDRSYWALKQVTKHNRLFIKNCLCEILLILLLYYEKSLVPEKIHYDKRLSDIHRLNPVFRFVENRNQEKISLGQVAAAAYMSPQYFCRFFKRVTGSTFMHYLQQIRIDKAKQLLLAGDMSVTQIAYEVGFESLSYFNRVFRQLTHLTPSEFLRMAEGRDKASQKH